MGIVLGLAAAVLYGSGDFAGGRASEGVDVRRVLLWSQGTGALGAIPVVLLVHGDAAALDLWRGVGAGVLTALGLGLLYRALSVGRASVVAPVTAVVGAIVPVAWGLATGERPGALALGGVACAIAAAALLARSNDGSEGPQTGVRMAMAAGLALGSSFVCYAATSDASGLWPLLAARFAALGAVAAALALSRVERVALPAPARRIAVVAGVCDVAATLALVAGLREELAVLVAALAALAPGFTVVCAWIFARQRLRRDQAVGVALALAGLAMIAAR
jgi:drug/metabolite transporter (DMT)-like permease